MQNTASRAPFLVWPVSRQEFYTTILLAMLPSLLWGGVIFGWRGLVVLFWTVMGATLGHALLCHRQQDRQRFLVSQSLVSALIVVSLSHPLWPWPILAASGFLIVVFIWLTGGPGREIVHPALLVALLLSLILAHSTRDAILTRDHLLTGNLANSTPSAQYIWGNATEHADAMEISQPSTRLAALRHDLVQLTRDSRNLGSRLDQAMALDLPSPRAVILGVVSGSMGTVSLVGILLGGLFLIYRNILRIRSCGLFLAVALVGLLIFPLSFTADTTGGYLFPAGLWRVNSDAVIALMGYEFFCSDLVFAAVVLLAMPGTEPVTSGGRRIYLFLAALLAVLLIRLNVPLPPASTALAVLQPLGCYLDRRA